MADVIRTGTDTSGRAILMTRYMADWWDVVCARLGFEPTIVQGAWMSRAGGGAAASAGYHDGGGCLDLRTWDITADQIEQVIRVTRSLGAGSWVRDHRHGMDPHIHLVLGTDADLSSGARIQWGQYVAGRSGLASNGADYHWRPDPLITDPRPLQEDDMPYTEKQLTAIVTNAVTAATEDLRQSISDLRKKEAQRFVKQIRELRDQGKDVDQIVAALATED